MYEIKEKQDKEKVILVAVAAANDGADEESAGESLDELGELCRTAGAEVVGRMVQNLPHFNPATYIGSGKIEELRAFIEVTGATGVVTDDELSPAQMHNLGKELDIKVMDRTMVILDIFAAHARTSEGKLQVELAQLQYMMSRLSGKGTSMSRLGGGIGTRGPGEKKLEQDRRVIRNRIARLRRELKDVISHRDVTRQGRNRSGYPSFAIVGYTNAGKSTLLNTLTGADILAEDKLFATLDTTTRVYEYFNKNKSHKVLLTDTVGFISKLPHNLVDAFRSTLEEAGNSDYIIHVVDASSRDMDDKIKVVYDTLDMLGIKEKKVITVFNKLDQIDDEKDNSPLVDDRAFRTVKVSATKGWGLPMIKDAMDDVIGAE